MWQTFRNVNTTLSEDTAQIIQSERSVGYTVHFSWVIQISSDPRVMWGFTV